MVMEVVQEDMGEGTMQCSIHPFKNNTPGGICASCLQEKLGKLVSSSSPVAIFPSTSSSPSPSFRSDFGTTTTTTTPSTLSLSSNARRAKLPFLLTQRKKKKEAIMAAADANSNIVFTRSISTATSSTTRNGSHFVYDSEDYSPQRKKFWSFLYLQRRAAHKMDMSTLGAQMNARNSRERKIEENVIVDESESPDQARRVSRSRSVGCGSRSFSGDFFERISTGFGDCTLRRVESQREGKPRLRHSMHRNSIGIGGGQDCIKERVKCGGIFSGFTITSSSSSSSSSYLVSSSNEDNFNGKKASTPGSHHTRNLGHPRSTSKNWSWAFASPMRAFSKPSNGKIDALNKNVEPNLAAIPSLLAGG